MDYLVFRLYGPMASWGEIAVGGNRTSANYPSKSAITGLLGAALGIKRENDELHLSLVDSYQQAVKVLSAGQLLIDYHTTQAPDSVGKFRYRTRRDEIVFGKDRLGTVLSSREYRTDALALVCISASKDASYSLLELQQALQRPKFHLYLGRKACPLALPLDASICEADNFRQALDIYSAVSIARSAIEVEEGNYALKSLYQASKQSTHYYWEGDLSDFSDEDEQFSRAQVQKLRRYDRPSSRVRWQFKPRTEYLWLQNSEVT